MKHRLLACAAFLLLPLGLIHAAELELLAGGKSEYQIVLPDKQATPALEEGMRQTARLLQAAFKANGVDVAVVAEANRDAAHPAIVLGDTALARANGVDTSKIAGWGYVLKVVGRDLIIAGREQAGPGTGPRKSEWDRLGTAKGVVDFLRQYMGVRFLYPDLAPRQPISDAKRIDFLASPAIEFLPTAKVAIPADLNVAKTPVLESWMGWPPNGSFYHLAQNRFPRVDDPFGGHTYERAIPPEKYVATHPEYFALLGGKRLNPVNVNAQYCISNPEVQELFYQDLISWLDAGYNSTDLGQPDGFRACQCENCAKLFDTGGDWSEKLWILHRNLAERVQTARPGKTVIMTSYILTANPPKTFKKFPANTQIMLTGTNEEDFVPWRGYEVPRGFTGYIYNWCPNLSTRYTPMRTPGMIEIQAKRLVANRIQSIYQDGPGTLQGLEGPVYYTMGRMYDDVQNNQAKALVHEFCEGAFGKAAPPMLQFYDQLYHAIELYSRHLGTRDGAWSYTDIYGRKRKYLTDPLQFLGFFYTPELLASLDAQLSQAEKLAASDKVKTRLRLVRREFNYLRSLAKVVHLYHAFEVSPDRLMRDRLLDAIDARNAEIASYFGGPRGGASALDNWAYVPFPPVGHNLKHLQLAHDGYQEPYSNTVFNWDTKAMRNAPLAGAKRISAAPTAEAITADSPQWQKAATGELVSPPGASPVTQKSTVRALYDQANVYLLIESELPAASMKAAAGPNQETVSVYLAPIAGRDLAYRFTGGLAPDSKADAAAGFVTDAMDPRHSQFDPDWNGDWKYESQLQPEKNRWIAFFKIPFKTLGVEAPKEGAFWRFNVSRVHLAANGPERSLWSATGGKSADDLNTFGEIAFDDPKAAKPAAAAGPSSIQKIREETYRTSFEIPEEWKKLPNPLPAPLAGWTFRKDPLDIGVKESWFAAAEPNAADWTAVKVPAFWAETEAVGKYQGLGWYRVTFEVPANFKGRDLRISFGAADEQAWVYVNGKLVREHSEASEKKSFNELWEMPFVATVPAAQVNIGKPNVLMVRVLNAVANGGLWRPVLVHAVDTK